MTRPGEIRGVNVRTAGQHGLGLYDVEGWLFHCSVEAASTETSGTWSALKISSAAEGSKAEDLVLNAASCDHAVDATGAVRIGGIHTKGTPTNAVYDVSTSTIWSRSYISPYSLGGSLVTGAGTFRLPFDYGARIISIRATVGTAPTGADLIIDVNKNGTTVFTTATRPTIPASSNISQIAIPDVVDLNGGDYLTIDVDQVGSTVAGEDLVVAVRLENDD